VTVQSPDLVVWVIATAVFLIAVLAATCLRRGRGSRPSSPHTMVPCQGESSRDALLDQIPDPIVRVDEHARVIEANRAARLLLPGLRKHDPLSLALRSPDVLEALENVIRTRGALKVDFSQRIPIERRFEVQITALETGSPQVGARLSTVLLFRDLTPAWRIERMRTDFVASASHELRTPLASILGFIERLRARPQRPGGSRPVSRDHAGPGETDVAARR
jgi:two-component system, OmpR family, phosphate regulon sensor histidine kinase PhoR